MKKILSLILTSFMMCSFLFSVSAEDKVEIDATFVVSENDNSLINAIPDNNSLAVKIDITNRGAEEVVTLYWAGYTDSGKIASLKTTNITLPANTTGEEKIISLTTVDSAKTYKLFAWGNAYIPYIDAFIIEREKASDWSAWYDYDFSEIKDAGETPAVTVKGASIKIPSTNNPTDIRFKTTVKTPALKDTTIIEQGVVVVPFYAIGEKDFTLSTNNVSKIANDGSQNIVLGTYSHEYVSVISGTPVYNYRSPLCVKGYITYSLNGTEKTIYSDIAIYDIYSIAEEVIKSSTENKATKTAVSTYIKDAYSAYMNNLSAGDKSKLSIKTPAVNEIVYPYKDYAKNYLLAGENLKEGQYASVLNYGPFGEFDVAKSIDISWTNKYTNVDTFTVAYATKEDFSDAKFAYAGSSAAKVSLYNLYKASDYYVKVIANLKDGTSYAIDSTFKTADLGPRQIHLDGSANARDLGGYMTSSGKRTVQGLLYRSGQMDKTYLETSTTLTAYGKYTAQRELEIITDLDFRGADVSPIPGATHMFVGLSGYDLVSTTNQGKIRDTFKILSNINNYPLVFHCTGGADRTGTVAYLLNALLGVSERDLIRDYEWTSYSIYSLRHINHEAYIAKPDYKFFTTLEAQNGKTLQARVANYLLSIGVTADEIENIRSIMLTGRMPRTITVPDEFKLSETVELKVKIGGSIDEISNVYIEGTEVEWKKAEDGYISISASEFISLIKDGETEVSVEFEDGEELSGTFDYDSTRNIIVCDEVSKIFDKPLTITVGAMPDTVSDVYVNDIKVKYSIDGHVITVDFDDIPSSIKEENITVTVEFKDGGKISGTTSYDPTVLCYIGDYMEATVLDASKTRATSADVGYGKWVRIHMEATNDTNGNYAVFVGSYGAKFRGGETRYHTLDANGTVGLDVRPQHYNITHSTFQNGNTVYLYIMVELVDDETFKVSLRAVSRSTGQILREQSYTGNRIENEMSSAPVTFVIDGSATAKLVVHAD